MRPGGEKLPGFCVIIILPRTGIFIKSYCPERYNREKCRQAGSLAGEYKKY
jgi:hypothetical protein